ncbi:MAG: aldo/keto reductase [Proteobacteria bacterium]|nr:aldo/keto reductase [Pseudomonadota bacterium]
MEYRRLGHSGLKVSPICLGTMMFGAQTNSATAARMVARAREAGINFIDTADAYNNGESERVTGKQIAKDRERWVLATKAANAMGRDPNHAGSGRRWLKQAIDDSRKRLNTDYVDILYLHIDDEATPLEETIDALGDIVASGKVHHIGLSNFRAWRIAHFAHLCERRGVPRPTVCQPYYNAMNRMPEVEVLPVCEFFGLGVVPYSPLARGVLTGKYKPGEKPSAGTRAGRADPRMMETEFRPESLKIAQRLKAHAEKRGMTPAQLAVNWVLNNKLVTSVIAGPRTFEQWAEYVDALDKPFAARDEALIDRFVPAGHPSTPGYSDPRYPITGRMSRV